jgi:hypothetical protein
MASFEDLRTAIDRLLSQPGVVSSLQFNSHKCDSAYEVYILSLCVEAVRIAGGTATPTGIRSGANPSILVFRGAPGAMPSRAQNFCYIDCELGDEKFEIHVDVQYEGTSGAMHEVDVSICTKKHCEDTRRKEISPKARNLRMIFECKFYEDSTPGVILARTFVGLKADVSNSIKLAGFISNTTTPGLKKYLSNSSRPSPFHVNPSDQDDEERFIRHVEQALKRWAIA